jgi:hypothetical protein
VVYNQENMFRRRKKKNKTVNETLAEFPLSIQAPDSDILRPAVVGTRQETKISPFLSDAFKSAIEKAADKSKNELVSVGKIKPMAFFVHADGTMKTVSLSVKDEYQKDVLTGRIREKALAENTSTVITLTKIDNGHAVVLSGVSSGIRGSARVDYGFDNETKTVTLWKITWLKQSAPNVFLDGIFDKTV